MFNIDRWKVNKRDNFFFFKRTLAFMSCEENMSQTPVSRKQFFRMRKVYHLAISFFFSDFSLWIIPQAWTCWIDDALPERIRISHNVYCAHRFPRRWICVHLEHGTLENCVYTTLEKFLARNQSSAALTKENDKSPSVINLISDVLVIW